jgi:hypothetical protein
MNFRFFSHGHTLPAHLSFLQASPAIVIFKNAFQTANCQNLRILAVMVQVFTVDDR